MNLSYAFYKNNNWHNSHLTGYQPGDELELAAIGLVDGNPDNPVQILEVLFETYNIRHPVGYEGRSMSVSDVIIIGETAWSCDCQGWRAVDVSTSFATVEDTLRSLSLGVEL
jgi:YodL-like